MMKIKSLIICFVFLLFAPLTSLAEQKPVEIFDIEEGKVVQESPTTSDIQKETEKMMKSISGVYKNLDPLPKKGVMVKIPLDPPISVKNEWFNDLVDEAVLIFSYEEEDPYILIWDDENLPHFYTFSTSTEKLMKLLKYQVKEKK
ncbi:hypothetical protein [Robertmurraya korlensis]|uniref:hypothetical protein n=1 Tax=Robertmurraya korlensis TaxID=519977 RepID=UPI000A82B488|nr:hypothetical protein [Robertmurraya korlensis]